jgi:hypothetical protein
LKRLGVAVFLTNLYSVFFMKKNIPLEIILCQNVGIIVSMEVNRIYRPSQIDEMGTRNAQPSYETDNNFRLKMEQRAVILIHNGRVLVR